MLSSILDTQDDLVRGKYSLTDLVNNCFKEIESNSHLNAFNQLYKKSASARAQEIQLKIEQGKQGKLAGAIISHKDNILKADEICSASSKILENFKSGYSATVIQKLESEDAIFIGNNNSDEFAMGSSNETSAFGKVLNPIDESYVPGGSSGGSAVSVAAGMCHVSLGTDTGGSVRQPAAYCGVKGFKPSFGLVSRYGLMGCGISLDCIGPMSRYVSDIDLIMRVIQGRDPKDPITLTQPQENHIKNKAAIYQNLLDHSMVDAEVKQAIENVIEDISREGMSIGPISYNFIEKSVPTYSIISSAEASDGFLKYKKNGSATHLDQEVQEERAQFFGHEVKRRIIAGQWVRLENNFDTLLQQARKIRQLITGEFDAIFSKYDFVILPTVPKTAFKFEAEMTAPQNMYNKDVLTVPASLAGLSAITLPIAIHSNGMPISIQVLAARHNDEALLSFAQKIESITNGHYEK